MGQLNDSANIASKVYIANWSTRYGHLAPSLRAFLEGHPDQFTVTPGNWNSYTVTLAKGAQNETKRARVGAEKGTEDDALSEIYSQLADPKNTESKVWIEDWYFRYGHLA